MGCRRELGAFIRTYEQTLSADDYPGHNNNGIACAGVAHLEKHGFKEGDKARVTVRIVKL